MGIGDIKIVLQPCPAVIFAVKDGNARGSPVYPASKLPVPALYFQNGGGVRALGIDQELLVKGQLIIVTGGGQKLLPAFRGRNAFQCFAV